MHNIMLGILMNDRRAAIIEELERVESDNCVRVLYACESGSRAWGFASPDSDFDVRFVYAHSPDWYLSVDLEHKRDVIELPIDDALDISGWDLRKALGLLRKSNPPLMEWLGSPIVYIDRFDTANGLRKLVQECFSPISCGYHYLRMAKKNYRGYLKGDVVRIKKYFYVLRPLLAVRWIEEGRGVVPTEFEKLVDAVVSDTAFRTSIGELLELKARSNESEYAAAIPELKSYIDSEIERLESTVFAERERCVYSEAINEFFRSQLRVIWSDA